MQADASFGGRDTAEPAAEPSPREPHPQAAPAVDLRPMTHRDLQFVTREHRRHFPDGFFPRLGPRFLAAYYRTFLDSPAARAYVAVIDDRPAAYLVGVIDPAAHRRHIIARHRTTLVLRAVAALSLRPALALQFTRTRLPRYGRALLDRPGSRAPLDPKPIAVLTHVAVTPVHQSRGLGSALIDQFARDAAAAGRIRVSLVTAAGTHGAGGYYARLGWRLGDSHRNPDGRWLTTYDSPVPTGPSRDTPDSVAR